MKTNCLCVQKCLKRAATAALFVLVCTENVVKTSPARCKNTHKYIERLAAIIFLPRTRCCERRKRKEKFEFWVLYCCLVLTPYWVSRVHPWISNFDEKKIVYIFLSSLLRSFAMWYDIGLNYKREFCILIYFCLFPGHFDFVLLPFRSEILNYMVLVGVGLACCVDKDSFSHSMYCSFDVKLPAFTFYRFEENLQGLSIIKRFSYENLFSWNLFKIIRFNWLF